jgi:hypothetical protein
LQRQHIIVKERGVEDTEASSSSGTIAALQDRMIP